MFFTIASCYAHFNPSEENSRVPKIIGGSLDVVVIATAAILAALVLANISISFPGIGTITNQSAIYMLTGAGVDLLIGIIAIVICYLKRNKKEVISDERQGLPGGDRILIEGDNDAHLSASLAENEDASLGSEEEDKKDLRKEISRPIDLQSERPSEGSAFNPLILPKTNLVLTPNFLGGTLDFLLPPLDFPSETSSIRADVAEEQSQLPEENTQGGISLYSPSQPSTGVGSALNNASGFLTGVDYSTVSGIAKDFLNSIDPIVAESLPSIDISEILREIIGRNFNDLNAQQLSADEMRYLARHAIFSLLSPEGKRALLAVIYRSLVPNLNKPYGLQYLATYDNRTITLAFEYERLAIMLGGKSNMPTTTLYILESGEAEVCIYVGRENMEGKMVRRPMFEKLDDHPEYESIITLIWHHMDVILMEIDPVSSKGLPSRMFREVSGWLQSMANGFEARTTGSLETLSPPNINGVSLPPPPLTYSNGDKEILPYTDSRSFSQEIANKQFSCIPFGQKCRQGNTSWTAQSEEFVNPVIASQDSAFRISVMQNVNQPFKVEFHKTVARGKHSLSKDGMISFQIFPDKIRVEIAGESRHGDDLYAKNVLDDAYYDLPLRQDQDTLQCIAYKKKQTAQEWSQLGVFACRDDGTWDHMGHESQKTTIVTEGFDLHEDLNYVLSCLITLHGIYTSPYTLIQGVYNKEKKDMGGARHLNGQETSYAMLKMLATIDQGKTQRAAAIIKPNTRRPEGLEGSVRHYLTYPRWNEVYDKFYPKKENTNLIGPPVKNNNLT